MKSKVTKLLMLIPIMLIVSGCSTMHFTHGPNTVDRTSDDAHESQWHGSSLAGLIEVNSPVNLYKNCEGKQWQQTTVEISPAGAMTTIVVMVATAAVAPILEGLSLYSPWKVETYCAPEP